MNAKNPDVQQFKGKLVTVFLRTINRDFKTEMPESYPKPLYRYFMGVIESITENGIVIQQATNGLKAFYPWDSIAGIAEEEILDPNDPEDAEQIKEFIKRPEIQLPPGGTIDADALSKLAEQMKAKIDD